jgi:hypothetical protein
VSKVKHEKNSECRGRRIALLVVPKVVADIPTYVSTVPAPNLGGRSFENERIALVQRTLRNTHLCEGHVVFCALDSEHAWLFFRWFDMSKSRFNTTLPVGKLSKHLFEFNGLVALHFTVLNRGSAKKVVCFDHLAASSKW